MTENDKPELKPGTEAKRTDAYWQRGKNKIGATQAVEL